MERRNFLTSSLLAASTGALAAGQQTTEAKGREYYHLRRYRLRSGSQRKPADGYFAEALVPALNRMGIGPVGVFSVEIAAEVPSLYVLMPCTSVDTLVTVDQRLVRDAEYLKAGAAFLNAPGPAASCVSAESSLMVAFEGRPRLTLPPATKEHRSRIFELRTYESPSDQYHKTKVEMFHNGEFEIFEKAGFWPVFYGDTLIGPRMPNLTYMLGYEDLTERGKRWNAFRVSPEWKQLSTASRFAIDDLVSNISNPILSPKSYSQI